jgi:hypothetical protein
MTSLAVAYHESGHAVARLVHGAPFLSVEIGEDGEGAVDVGRHREYDRLRAAVRCLAGPLAEARFTGQRLAEVFEEGGRLDLAMARDALGGTGVDMEDAIEATVALMHEHWPAVRRLADVLAERGALSYGEAQEIWGGR